MRVLTNIKPCETAITGQWIDRDGRVAPDDASTRNTLLRSPIMTTGSERTVASDGD
jgi:hypothetical protein